MSQEIGRAVINLQLAARIARTEYNDNWEIMRHFTGKDPRIDPSAYKGFYDAVDLDILFYTNDGPVDWSQRGRVTDMGHAAYMEDGSDFHESNISPFAKTEDVLAFNAVEEYGLPDFNELVEFYEKSYQSFQTAHDRQLIPGGYYKTLVSGAIQAFGWEMLLQALGEAPERFGENVLGSIFELSLHCYKAWAETSIECFICHDDMVWTQGPFANPAFYRKYIFPRYAELWRPLREAGKKVLYCSDGTFDMFLDDLAEAGADGFIFEPTNDLELMVRKYGKTHVLVGGADCRTLTFGTKEDIQRELEWAFGLAKECPGFVFAAGNHLPANIPIKNAIFYFDTINRLGRR